MRAFILALLLGGCTFVATPGSQRDSAVSIAGVDWMAGYWLSCEDGRETAENWIGAGTGTLLGTNLSGGGFEFLRIAADDAGTPTYFSMPNGRSPPTPFALTENTGQRAVFENLQHDFPQRIIYERDGDVMVARIEGPVDGRVESMQWRFERAATDARCQT